MIITLEAPDGAGKSTLANKIAAEWTYGPAEVVHIGPPPDKYSHHTNAEHQIRCQRTLVGQMATPFLKWKVQPSDKEHLVVLDRAHWGSAIYAMFRPHTNEDGFGDLQLKGVRAVDEILTHAGGLTAVLLPGANELIKRSKGRDDPFLDSVPGTRDNQLRDTYNRYLAFCRDFASCTQGSFLAQPFYAQDGIYDDVMGAPGVREWHAAAVDSSWQAPPKLYRGVRFSDMDTWDMNMATCQDPERVANYLITRMLEANS